MIKIGFYGSTDPHSGGVYQYTLSLLEALKEYDKGGVTVFTYPGQVTMMKNRYPMFDHVEFKVGRFQEFIIKLFITGNRLKVVPVWVLRMLFSARNVLKKSKVDIVIYPSTTADVLLHDIPSIVPIHDLGHRLHPEFPEIGSPWVIRGKRHLYNTAVKYSSLMLADSKAGKDDILQIYKVNNSKVRVLPFVPPTYLLDSSDIDVKEKFGLKGPYIFYPAQFWVHKNHIRLLEAIKMLKEKGIKVKLLLVGARKNNYDHYKNKVDTLGLKDQVRHLEYVKDEYMASLYKSATCLIFPSLLGPTNIPPLEAFLLGCPVVAAKSHPGMEEQIGDAGLLFDPYSVESIAVAIEKVWCNVDLQRELKQKGFNKTKEWNQEKFNERFKEILCDFLGEN